MILSRQPRVVGEFKVSEKPSKSARKREHLAAQALGERLIELGRDDLARLPLEENLVDAIRAAGGMTSRGALRRQRQLIGKLMARSDCAAIREAYDALQRDDQEEKALFRDAERWRDRLVGEGRPALAEFVERYGGETEPLAGLVDALPGCRDDRARRRARRLLFRAIRDRLGDTRP